MKIQRHQKILGILEKNGVMTTLQLARTLDVTETTIRRDLKSLGKVGSLIRESGGAARVGFLTERAPEQHPSESKTEFPPHGKSKALDLIESCQTIFLDGSNPAQKLAREIPDKPLTIITNSLDIPKFFFHKAAITVVLLGGNFRPRSRSVIGYPAIASLTIHRIDAAFLSCHGIDVVGLSEASEEEAELKRHIVDQSGLLVLLPTSETSPENSPFLFARYSDVDFRITDFSEARPNFKLEPIKSRGSLDDRHATRLVAK